MRVVLGSITDDQKKALETWSSMPQSTRARYQEQIMVEKWAKSGWLNPEDAKKDIRGVVQEFHGNMGFPKLRDERDKQNMAMILENQTQFQQGRRINVVNNQ